MCDNINKVWNKIILNSCYGLNLKQQILYKEMDSKEIQEKASNYLKKINRNIKLNSLLDE